MYTDVKSVQILISLMKNYNIKHVVISPGTRIVPLVHSIENDSYFKCYSIVDERSAGFFALGLVQILEAPVAVCCTSGTAVCNFASAASEAKNQRLPLLIITGDRAQYLSDQYQDQMVPNNDILRPICKKSVCLPTIKDSNDEWRSLITLNQAFSELDYKIPGPIHINVPITENEVFLFNTKHLPEAKCIKRITLATSNALWMDKVKKLCQSKRILIVCGQHKPFNENEKEILEKFSNRFNCVFIYDHISNLNLKNGIKPSTAVLLSAQDTLRKLAPDILITFGGHSLSGISAIMNAANTDLEHWLINNNGEFIDSFKKLNIVFECSSNEFFDFFIKNSENLQNDEIYLQEWKRIVSKYNITDFGYSDLFAVQEFVKQIPNHSILHLANSLSVRYAQFFEINDKIKIYCNRGSNGIDGSMSAFIGSSNVCEQLSFLLIGDLSFFYDMTALWNRYLGKNIRILLNNNSGGMLFNSKVFWRPYDGVNNFVAAEHHTSAKAWCETCGFNYLSASNLDEFNENLSRFVDPSTDGPILFEVFTDKQKNNQILTEFVKQNKEITTGRIVNYIANKIKR